MIPAAQRKQLLELARQAAFSRVRRQSPPPVPADLDVQASGAFVTLYHRGELRGCLGTLDEHERVAAAVVRLAGDVTHRDPRFAPVAPEELPDLRLDISVLTPPTRVHSVDEIVVGRDGLIVEDGLRRGLLLPQVAPEHGFDRDTFLAHTCLKAGLPADAWQRGAAVFRFQAEVFGDDDFVS